MPRGAARNRILGGFPGLDPISVVNHGKGSGASWRGPYEVLIFSTRKSRQGSIRLSLPAPLLPPVDVWRPTTVYANVRNVQDFLRVTIQRKTRENPIKPNSSIAGFLNRNPNLQEKVALPSPPPFFNNTPLLFLHNLAFQAEQRKAYPQQTACT